MRSSIGAASLLGAVVTAGAALLAGCSNGSPAPAPTVTVTKTASSTPSAPASATEPVTGQAAGPARCQSGALKVALGPGNAAAGSQIIPIQFTNVSTSTCTLFGFPGVSFTGETYAVQVGPAAARNHASAEQVVTLAPGAVASALIKIVNAQNYPAGPCGLTTASGILVYPPNLTTAVGLPFNGFACVHKWNVLTVNAVVPGPGT
jgi:Protein of unknown function (DUF4232)